MVVDWRAVILQGVSCGAHLDPLDIYMPAHFNSLGSLIWRIWSQAFGYSIAIQTFNLFGALVGVSANRGSGGWISSFRWQRSHCLSVCMSVCLSQCLLGRVGILCTPGPIQRTNDRNPSSLYLVPSSGTADWIFHFYTLVIPSFTCSFSLFEAWRTMLPLGSSPACRSCESAWLLSHFLKCSSVKTEWGVGGRLAVSDSRDPHP